MLKKVGLTVGVIVAIAAVIVGVWLLASNYLSNHDNISSCQKLGVNHLVILKNDQPNPVHTYGKLCDTMTIANKDNAIRLMAFGPHEHHQPYDGITEHVLGPNQSFTITLNEIGTYHFHDHLKDIIQGQFTVSR